MTLNHSYLFSDRMRTCYSYMSVCSLPSMALDNRRPRPALFLSLKHRKSHCLILPKIKFTWNHNFYVTWRTFLLQGGRARSVLAGQPRNRRSVHIMGKIFFSISKRPSSLWNTLSGHRQGSPRRWGCQSMKRTNSQFWTTQLHVFWGYYFRPISQAIIRHTYKCQELCEEPYRDLTCWRGIDNLFSLQIRR